MASIAERVRRIVDKVEVVDVHTHLFPPSHGDLLLWGIDELLTYHYLIAELFRVAPLSLRPESFYELSKREQADLVWEHLFVARSPISEAARGVLTTLCELGLRDLVRRRDLQGIREYFGQLDPEEYLERVFQTARVKYAVMTNIPFDEKEAVHFEDAKPIPSRLKTALRVDALFEWEKACEVLRKNGFPPTYDGAKAFLRRWNEKMSPVYLMASFPFDLRYPAKNADDEGDAANLIDGVMVPLARELGLPIALKCGTQRQVNPSLRSAGDR